MKLPIKENELNLCIKNIKNYYKKTQRLRAFQRGKYLGFNTFTTSKTLNVYLINKLAVNALNPITPTPPTPAEITRASQLSLLKSACSSDADLLSYKGINLGSAINMKLAVKLGSLLGKQQG